MNKQLQPLLQKEMTRKEFLTMAGFGLISIFGFSSILKFLLGHHNNSNVSSGYGSSPYGK